MSDPIRIRYTWSRDNVEKLFASSYTYLFGHSGRRYVGWLFIALLQFGLVAAFKQGTTGLLMFSAIVLIYWYYGKRFIAHRRAIASWKASPFRDMTITILADEEGLTIHCDGGEAQWSWETIDGVTGMGSDVLIHLAPHFYYIPEGAFGSIEAKSRFKALAKSHGKLTD